MAKPENFISNSDYATLKNDAYDTMSVTFVGGQFLAANGSLTTSSDVTIGTINASMRARVSSTKEAGTFYVGNVMVVSRLGSTGGPFDVPYSLLCFLSRINPTTLRATATVQNPYADNMFLAVGDETFTFEVSTFLSPFV